MGMSVTNTFFSLDSISFNYCRPRMNHKMYWGGGECPLPEGFEVEVYYRLRGTSTVASVSVFNWMHNNTDADIIGYEILGLVDDWVYLGESDE